jgi:hypothetical protein
MNGEKAGTGSFRVAVLGGILACVFIIGNVARAQHSTAPAPPGSQLAQTPVMGASSAIVTEMKSEEGKHTLKADKTDLVALLKKISLASGVPIEIGMGVSAAVTAEFVGLNLEEGVSRILAAVGEKNLETEYANTPGAGKDGYKIEKVAVVKLADPAVQKAKEAEINAMMLKREQDYREFFALMDKEGNKIARAIEEYVDPGTSQAKKTKLRTYLRQTPVDDPQDKKVLKAASLDHKYAPLLEDIHTALLHAIQDHPEESDKEFLLDLLRKKIAPGWLLYAMPKIWDQRYVTFLIDYAKIGDYVSIGILGAQKVEAAVPVLEEVLKDQRIDRAVRVEAMKSLWLITGKRYEDWE